MPGQSGAFLVQGPTVLISCTTVALAPVQPSTAGKAGIQGLRLTNISTVDAYLMIGATTATAIVPSTAVASFNSFPLLQRSSLLVSTPPNCWVSGITTIAATPALVAMTPGYGIL